MNVYSCLSSKGTPPSFSAIRVNSPCYFLIASLDGVAFPKRDLLLKERIYSYGSIFTV